MIMKMMMKMMMRNMKRGIEKPIITMNGDLLYFYIQGYLGPSPSFGSP